MTNLPTGKIEIKHCDCVISNRRPNETMRQWLQRILCDHHWKQTDYYLDRVKK